ncbi:MAG: branched-chain amino acid ABC transporter permease [Bacillota bacterium]
MKDRTKSYLLWAIILAAGIIIEVLGRLGIINAYLIQVIELIGINIMLVASLNLINGYLGEFAIGHAGFMAMGAYISAILTVNLHLPFFLAFIAGGAAAALASYLIGIPAFKTFGDYLAIITLGFNMIIVSILNNLEYVGGPRGMVGLPKSTTFLWVFGATIITLVVLRNLVYSNYGRLWIAIRENSIAAEMMGVNVNLCKLKAFVVAGFFAGLAGALWGHMLQYINPSSFTYIKSTEILVMLYLGGMGSLTGSVIGATLMTGLLESLRDLGVWRMVLSPLVLVVIMLTRPIGIFGYREIRGVAPREEVRRNATAAG